MKTLGQIAYETYCKASKIEDVVPGWEKCGDSFQKTFEAVAEAVRLEVEERIGDESKS